MFIRSLVLYPLSYERVTIPYGDAAYRESR